VQMGIRSGGRGGVLVTTRNVGMVMRIILTPADDPAPCPIRLSSDAQSPAAPVTAGGPGGVMPTRCRRPAGGHHRRRRPTPWGEAAAPRAGEPPQSRDPKITWALHRTPRTQHSLQDALEGPSGNRRGVVLPAEGWRGAAGDPSRRSVVVSCRVRARFAARAPWAVSAAVGRRFAPSTSLVWVEGVGRRWAGAEWAALRAHAPLVSSDSTHARCCPMRFIDAVASAGLQQKAVGSQ
jgi:hypothetical protein